MRLTSSKKYAGNEVLAALWLRTQTRCREENGDVFYVKMNHSIHLFRLFAVNKNRPGLVSTSQGFGEELHTEHTSGQSDKSAEQHDTTQRLDSIRGKDDFIRAKSSASLLHSSAARHAHGAVCQEDTLLTTPDFKAARATGRTSGAHLGLHELGVVLVDLHLLDLLLAVLGVQQAVGLQHLDLILQVSDVALQRGDFGVLRTEHTQSRKSSGAARRRPRVACCQITLGRGDERGGEVDETEGGSEREREGDERENVKKE